MNTETMRARTSTIEFGEEVTLTDHAYEVCRDERCPIVEVHEAHEPGPTRGRAPKLCPDCGAPTIKVADPKAPTRLLECHCSACTWQRI